MKRFRVNARVAKWAEQEVRERALWNLRRQAGNELYNILYSDRLPAVVDIEEKSEEVITSSFDYSNNYYDEYTIEITVNPVQHKHIVFSHADYDWRTTNKPQSIIQRVLNFIRGKK